MKTLLFPASVMVVAGCARDAEQAPVDEADTGVAARLDASRSFTYAPGYGLGTPFPAAGDINRDGRIDLVFGLDNGGGRLNVFANDGTPTMFPSTPSQSVVVNDGSTHGDEERIALGDFNCDGRLDAALGVRGYTNPQTNEGAVFFFAGLSGGTFATTPTWTLESNTASDMMGAGIIAYDANRDGCMDLIAAGDARTRRIIGGAAGPALQTAAYTALAAPDTYRIENLGDLNGDGNEDFGWCYGYYNSGQGRAIIYLGTGLGFPTAVHQIYTGTGSEGLCGGQLANGGRDGRGMSSGDIDNDGYDDLVIGIPGTSSGNGRVDIYRGGTTGLSTVPSWTLNGLADTTNGRFGTTVLAGFDQNGDGFEDVLVGEPVLGTKGTMWMFPGSPVGPVRDGTSWSLGGLLGAGGYGKYATAPGDLNGDGYDDVLINDYGYLETESHVVLGQPDGDNDKDGAVDPIDCNDADPAISPLATEIAGNMIDENCSGYDDCYKDVDKDKFGTNELTKNTTPGCDSLESEASVPGDCGLPNSAIYPGAPETIGDGLDQDCDGTETCRADADFDTHGSSSNLTKSLDTDCFDSGESTTTDDCNDSDPTVYKGAPEVVGDGKDQDCDGQENCYLDFDRDTFGHFTSTAPSVDTDCDDLGESMTKTDCDDNNASVSPASSEIVGNGLDENCDKGDTCYLDGDGDTFGGTATTASPDLDCSDFGESPTTTDCLDSDNAVKPGATELVADGKDQNCDTFELCYKDVDLDAHGVTTTFVGNDLDCLDAGEAPVADDCDDSNVLLFPGNVELVADGLDQDCDNGDTCYLDGDADKFGGLATVISTNLSCADSGESTVNTDCDDAKPLSYPGATEVLADGIDQDCDKGDTCYTDADEDTYGVSAGVDSVDLDCIDAGEAVRGNDCKDANAAINPSATEIANDGIDQNCDGVDSCLLDSDGDGFGGTTLRACASGGIATGGDCNDSSNAIKPGATELPVDGVDQNCDGLESCYIDADGDGAGGLAVGNSTIGCAATGFSSTKDDCADTNPAVGPSKADVAGDLVDRDCDGKITCFADTDDDGFAGKTTIASADADCADPGEGLADLDCSDTDATVHPGAEEIGGDGIDQDCDKTDVCWHDGDGDGYGDTLAPTTTLGCLGADESTLGGDCDDDDASISPNEDEIVGNTRDDDCDGYATCRQDLDGDGFGGVEEDLAGGTLTDPIVCEDEGDVSVGGDCDDDDDATRPDVTSEPFGEDRDCDGVVTCLADVDGDGFGSVEIEIDVAAGATPGCFVVQGDCDDADKSTSPEAAEVAGNEVDEDCDGTVDCFVDGDGDGFGSTNTLPTTSCTSTGVSTASTDCDDASAGASPDGLEVCDGLDNDCDFAVDEDFEFADPSDPTTCSDDTVKFCGCDSSPAAGLGWFTLAAALIARRRRG